MLNSLQNRHVLVLGLGLSGLAMARWCTQHGARVTVADTRAKPPQLQALQTQLPAARFVSGALDAALLDEDLALVCRSPGIDPHQLQSLQEAAARRDIVVCSELDLFVRALAELESRQAYAPRVLAITGTNGKTTVTDLCARLLQGVGLDAAAAGNIGPGLLDALQERQGSGQLPSVWVLELSSFQLATTHAFDPAAATVLNLSQDHLDWHGGMAGYAQAKARVFGPHTRRLLNRDDRVFSDLLPGLAHGISFGADAPVRPGDFGLVTQAGVQWLAWLPATPGADRQLLLPAAALRIHGLHNVLNALAALALVQLVGVDPAATLHVLREYRGQPHRVQSIGLIDGVEYIDDSKGTNVGATVAALQGLGRDRKVVVLLGGDGKAQDFSPLVEPVRQCARAVVLMGRDAPRLRRALVGTGVLIMDAGDMSGAVQQAAQVARTGDAVLLSPACSSLDMYRSYIFRAQAFVDAVADLARSRGSELEVAA